MAVKLSRARQAIRDRDLQALKKALESGVSEEVLLGCAADLFERNAVGFERVAFPLLLEHGLDPNAIPKVSPHPRFSDALPNEVEHSLRLKPQGAFGQDDVGLPLASRAALMDPVLLEHLLEAGADPQRGGMVSAFQKRPLMFGSAWASALAMTGKPVASQVLEVLERHDTRPWTVESGVVADAMRAFVHPGMPAPPPSVDQTREAWQAIESRLPPLSRSQWASVWLSAVGWSVLSTQSPSRHRLMTLVEVLPAQVLAGLFDASREKGWDLRGLAQAADLDGKPGPWQALERHWEELGCDDIPVWGQTKVSTLLPDGGVEVHTVPMDGLAHLLMRTRWPGSSPSVFERADAWLARFGNTADPLIEGKTRGQWWMAEASSIAGAPADWVARHDRFWQPNPHTGRTPLHECQTLWHLGRGTSEQLNARLDWHAVDNEGNEAGATALALASNLPSQATQAIKLLNSDQLWASGECAGRPASAWVAFHPELRAAYDASCARRGIGGVRRARSPWRLHAAVEAMSVPRVRQILSRLTDEQKIEALTQVDSLGRTPLVWWALARPKTKSDGKATKNWYSSSREVFRLLTEPGAPMWEPGMEFHPFAVFAGKDLDFEHSREGRSKNDLLVLAEDYGKHLVDPGFRRQAWEKIAPDWMEVASSASTQKVWESWPLPREGCAELLIAAWDQWCKRSNQLYLSSKVVSATRQTLNLWARAGAAVDASDLSRPDFIAAFDRLIEAFPSQAQELEDTPVLGVAVQAYRLEQALPGAIPPPAPARKIRF